MGLGLSSLPSFAAAVPGQQPLATGSEKPILKQADSELGQKMKLGCTVCYELFTDDSDGICAIRCGHIFHHACLLQWLENSSRKCPQCRAKTSEDQMIRLHRSYIGDDDDEVADTSDLSNQVRDLTVQVESLEKESEQLRKEKTVLEEELAETRKVAKETEEKLKVKSNKVAHMEALLMSFSEAEKEAERANKELEKRRRELIKLGQGNTESMDELHDVDRNSPQSEMVGLKLLKESDGVQVKSQRLGDFFNHLRYERIKRNSIVANFTSSPGIQQKEPNLAAPDIEIIAIEDSPVALQVHYQNPNLKRKRASMTDAEPLDATPSSSSSTETPVPSTSAGRPKRIIKKRLR